MAYSFGPARRRAALIAMLAGLPVLTCYAFVCLTDAAGAIVVPWSWPELTSLVRRFPRPSLLSCALYGAWLLLQIALYLALPGRAARGASLENGTPLTYRMNGWPAFWCTWALVLVAIWSGMLPATIGYDQLGPLLVTAHGFAFALAAWMYAIPDQASGASRPRDAIARYVTGASLNPRIRGVDVKFFCESRPGLILWVLLNASFAAKQYALLGRVTTPMLMVNAFQFLYVADYFWHEDAILSTWDIRHERFGWMLCWGSLVWVPFMYSIQACYLVTHAHELPVPAVLAIVALNTGGYVIFRAANLQKHRFRTDPSRPVWGRPPDYIRTASGALLLTSGWWGMARHLNYLGDLMMGLAWCLTAGFEHPWPYFYVVYFVILLVHRERRDYEMCLAKYGPDWEAYCRKVPWRIVPGVY